MRVGVITKGAGHVHFATKDGALLCGNGRVFTEPKADDEPVTCANCWIKVRRYEEEVEALAEKRAWLERFGAS